MSSCYGEIIPDQEFKMKLCALQNAEYNISTNLQQSNWSVLIKTYIY